MTYQILKDSDVLKHYKMKPIIVAIERVFHEQANGTLISPPRFKLETENGNLIFTAGAATGSEKVIGFRVYDTFLDENPGHEQLVAVFDSVTGVFKGIIIGNLLGAIRTGAIGGVAIKLLSRTDAEHLAIIGTGMQARTQLEAAAAVRNFKSVKVYSRNGENRKTFAKEMSKRINMDVIPTDSAKKCVEEADIVICATNSPTPVLDMEWLKPGVHINTVGPKSIDAHELPLEVSAKCSLIATDSLQQLASYSSPHFLINTPYENNILQLSEILVMKEGQVRKSADDITLFCSVGLSGTEVVVANEIMKCNHQHVITV